MRRHELDVTSLVAGVLFVVAGIAFVVGEVSGLRLDARWLVPMLLVGAGAIGLAGALRRPPTD